MDDFAEEIQQKETLEQENGTVEERLEEANKTIEEVEQAKQAENTESAEKPEQKRKYKKYRKYRGKRESVGYFRSETTRRGKKPH